MIFHPKLVAVNYASKVSICKLHKEIWVFTSLMVWSCPIWRIGTKTLLEEKRIHESNGSYCWKYHYNYNYFVSPALSDDNNFQQSKSSDGEIPFKYFDFWYISVKYLKIYQVVFEKEFLTFIKRSIHWFTTSRRKRYSCVEMVSINS